MNLLKYITTKGAKIPDHKERTRNLKVETIKTPKHLYYLMAMHIGKPAKPVVKLGDYVKIGTLLGKNDGGISANIHSSVSGTVILKFLKDNLDKSKNQQIYFFVG
jgi:electron transport complex protein RnfC